MSEWKYGRKLFKGDKEKRDKVVVILLAMLFTSMLSTVFLL